MISEIPASAFEIPQYALWMIAGWVLTTLITGWLGYRSGLRSQERSDIRRERAVFIPILKDAIVDCMGVGQQIPQPLHSWQQRCMGIKTCADRFSTFLKGKRKTAFDAAWNKCCQTQNAELQNKNQSWFVDGEKAELKAAQNLITSRLQAVLDCVERA